MNGSLREYPRTFGGNPVTLAGQSDFTERATFLACIKTRDFSAGNLTLPELDRNGFRCFINS